MIFEGLAVVAMTLGPCCNNDATCSYRVTCVVDDIVCEPVSEANVDDLIVFYPTCTPHYWCECVDKDGRPEPWSQKRQDGEVEP